jgi:hypothetical protein
MISHEKRNESLAQMYASVRMRRKLSAVFANDSHSTSRL